ncbi:hypothetical protein F3Y22_tig00116964pilonHSYRG00573 [Hibiscus syriacus]|uniref:Uncharacterized protein n=1 Tax=Hibiscus syriacus TaxID=106335 RepID=A0A6A2XAZ9_HIBSY|nr:uncharacterized protein LOC120190985 [Hibiscus syriacus]KAE8659296.1 hypothetical protein F3Y22_tig00116964pilonHSYRG00573 [Hibiscus syriacus]
MKGRKTKGAPSADLLVCFPSRAHLTLMLPKHICSPARPSEPNKRNHHRLLKKSSTRNGGGQASPLLWAKNKHMGSEITEPTSPKVTCAGQIKVKSKTSSCKSWQSVMEEIERIHKKRPSWMESLGFKKEVMQFLTCLPSIHFDFRCFGSFPQSDITTDDEDEEEEEYQENDNNEEGNETSRTIFSKWFMVLQENQSNGFYKEEEDKEKEISLDHFDDQPAVPPSNALFLMRCRSAPAKSWLESKRVEENEKSYGEEEGEKLQECKRKDEGKRKNLRCLMDEENRKMKESLVVMKYGPDFRKISSDIAQETWLVGGMKDPLSRSRSWKR